MAKLCGTKAELVLMDAWGFEFFIDVSFIVRIIECGK